MDLITANRLQQLRKMNGYSQDVLAEKLGVSRQAVSKWERAESSPDTDNLISLAKLYGLTLDDLLNTSQDVIKIKAKPQEKDFRQLAIKAVVEYFNSQVDSTDKNGKITEDQVFVVWMTKVLQNNKALLSTTIPDGMYYEATWNGDKNEGYLDAYKKWKNLVFKEE